MGRHWRKPVETAETEKEVAQGHGKETFRWPDETKSSSRTSSGKGSSHSYFHASGRPMEVVLQPPIARAWKASCGCFAAALAGVTCPSDTPRRAPVGDAWSSGKTKRWLTAVAPDCDAQERWGRESSRAGVVRVDGPGAATTPDPVVVDRRRVGRRRLTPPCWLSPFPSPCLFPCGRFRWGLRPIRSWWGTSLPRRRAIASAWRAALSPSRDGRRRRSSFR
jgi:hypothetical protein